MSDIFRMIILVAHGLVQPFLAYFDRVSHWHPLAAMGLPIGIFFALKALLPAWLVSSIVYTLNAASIVVFGAMYWTCIVQPRRNSGTTRE